MFCYSIPQEEAPGNRILQERSQDFMEIVELADKTAHMTDDELEKIIIDV